MRRAREICRGLTPLSALVVSAAVTMVCVGLSFLAHLALVGEVQALRAALCECELEEEWHPGCIADAAATGRLLWVPLLTGACVAVLFGLAAKHAERAK